MAEDFVARARALVGCRFRPQGRSPELGLDCVGLALCTYGMKDVFRRDYRLRGDHAAELRAGLQSGFRRIGRARARAGDLLLWRISTDQLHLVVLTEAGYVHADAGIGRIVEVPGSAPWKLVASYQPRRRSKD